MAILHPFKALHPQPEVASKVACVPYDVINTHEAREMAIGNPDSFLHVIRPEIDFAEGIDEHANEVYAKGAENLRVLTQSSNYLEESAPSLYVYRLMMNGRSQTGIFGCVAVSDYDNDVILKHELTRPDKEDDRTRHILEQSAHAEPVMLTFRGNDAVSTLMETTMQVAPLYDFTANDGIQHTIWKVEIPEPWVDTFAQIEKLYVADGHHRCKAASRAVEATRVNFPDLEANAEINFFPAVLFPMDQMAILAYNRIVYELPQGKQAFILSMKSQFALREHVSPTPEKAGDVSMYLNGTWYGFSLSETAQKTVADSLDVSRLGEFVLAPILNIHDARTDQNIHFVGGIRGTAELERLVDAGKAEVAFSMYPTQIEELLAVSDAGLLMPPKSTWFEPKLRSGLLVHLF